MRRTRTGRGVALLGGAVLVAAGLVAGLLATVPSPGPTTAAVAAAGLTAPDRAAAPMTGSATAPATGAGVATGSRGAPVRFPVSAAGPADALTPSADPAPADPTELVDGLAVGALFDGTADDLGDHFCSASVIDTPRGDVVLTAAHCVADGDGDAPRTDIVFVPGYHDGIAPFGAWDVTATVVDPRWADGADPDLDIALLTVARDGAGPVQSLTGALTLVTDPGSGDDVTAVGYPDDTDAPVTGSGTTTRFSATQLRLAGPDLPDGTSGGPWVRGGTEVVGVTGGYEQGGDTDDVSYASYLDDDTTALLARLTG